MLCSVLLLQLIACVMPGSRSSTDPEHKSPRESGEDSEDESEILEESPCGRWLKRREEVHSFFFLSIHLSICLYLVYPLDWNLVPINAVLNISSTYSLH